MTRIVVGNVVVDHEVVHRNFPEGRGEVDVICTYEIAGREDCKRLVQDGRAATSPACGLSPAADAGSAREQAGRVEIPARWRDPDRQP
jgi:hypothetical protein